MKTHIYSIALLLTMALMISCNHNTNVLVIVGGHDYDTIEFIEMFQSIDGVEFELVSHPGAIDMLRSSMVNDFDILIFYDFIPNMPLKDSTIFTRLTSQGKPMIFLHHSICSFQNWDGYKQMVGGKYLMPEFEKNTSLHSDYRHDIDLDVVVLNQDHPVTEGVDDFIIHDEGYSNIQVNDNVLPLFGTSHPDCHPLMGWVTQAEKSTILYLMFGHDKNAYANESFHNILSNSIHWMGHL